MKISFLGNKVSGGEGGGKKAPTLQPLTSSKIQDGFEQVPKTLQAPPKQTPPPQAPAPGLLGAIWGGITKAVTSVGDAIGTVVEAVGSAVGTAGKAVGKAIVTAAKAVGSAVGTAVKAVGNTVSTAVKAVGKAVGTAVKAVGKAISTAAKAVGNAVVTTAKKIGNAVVTAAKAVGKAIVNVGKKAFEVVGGAVMFVGMKAVSGIQTLLGIEKLRSIYGNSVDFSKVTIKEDKLGLIGVFNSSRPFVVGNTIYVPKSPISEYTLAHEMMHVWQYQNGGSAYLGKAVAAQLWGPADANGNSRGYYYEGDVASGKPFEKLNPEQQAYLIENALRSGFLPPNDTVKEFNINVDGTSKNFADYVLRAWGMVQKGQGAP